MKSFFFFPLIFLINMATACNNRSKPVDPEIENRIIALINLSKGKDFFEGDKLQTILDFSQGDLTPTARSVLLPQLEAFSSIYAGDKDGTIYQVEKLSETSDPARSKFPEEELDDIYLVKDRAAVKSYFLVNKETKKVLAFLTMEKGKRLYFLSIR